MKEEERVHHSHARRIQGSITCCPHLDLHVHKSPAPVWPRAAEAAIAAEGAANRERRSLAQRRRKVHRPEQAKRQPGIGEQSQLAPKRGNVEQPNGHPVPYRGRILDNWHQCPS